MKQHHQHTMYPSTASKMVYHSQQLLPNVFHPCTPTMHRVPSFPLLSLRGFCSQTRVHQPSTVVTNAAPSKTRTAAPWLAGVDKEHHDDVLRVVEQAERAVDDWSVKVSDFYPPPVVFAAAAAIQGLADAAVVPWGGYAQAERCRLIVGREELLMDAQHNPAQHGEVALITVRGNFLFDPATHRDFLGASLNTGVQRSQVGDIIPQGEMGAQMLVAQHMVGHFETTLTHVKKVSVEVRAAPLSELRVREPKVEELRSVEASMRLDAVASAGFRTSRSKVADWISKGDVRLNWKTTTKGSVTVAAGDLISVSGKGRVTVLSVDKTAKGKYIVQLQRFV